MRLPNFMLLHETAGDPGAGGGGGTDSGGATPGAPSGDAATGGTRSVPGAGGTPARTPAGTDTGGAKPATTTHTYAEDRSKWLSPEAVDARVRAALGAPTAEAERLRKMLEAGTGVKVPGPQTREEQEIEQARQLLLERILPPGFKKMLDFFEKNQNLLSTLEQRGPELFTTADSIWDQRANTAVESVFAEAAKAMGVQELTQYQQRALGNMFTQWIASDGKNVTRFKNGDPKLVSDFITEWRTGFVDPLRRTSQTPGADTSRRTGDLPSVPKRSGVPAGGGRQPAPKSEDDVHDAAYKQFEAIVNGSR